MMGVFSINMLIIHALHILEASRKVSDLYISWAIQDFPHPEWTVVRDLRKKDLAELRRLIEDLEFPVSIHYIDEISSMLNVPQYYTPETKDLIKFKLGEMQQWFERETDQVYVHVNKKNVKLLQKSGSDLFGAEVMKAFPSIDQDVSSAANCMVFELHTACVFHLMRVLEKGLRALARHTPSLEGVVFDYENMGTIIDRIESAINNLPQLQDLTKGSKEKSDRITFFAEAAVHFRYLTNAWRNHTMHSRRTFLEGDAQEVWLHVDRFMEHLAKNKITEVL